MGAASYVDALFSALENQRNVTLKSQTIEKGAIKDAELVLLRLFRDKEYKESSRVKSFKVEIGESYEGHLTPLSSLWLLAFIVHQREFDGFWAAAKIDQIMKQNVQALHEREATLANLQVSAKNKGVDNLSEDEKKKLRKAKDAVQEARDLIDEHLDTVYDAYERMMDVRKHKFTNLVRSECLTAKDHVVNKVVLIKEAFRADPTTGAAVPVDRLPDKDNEDQPDDPKTAGFRIEWRWERRDETVHGMPGKTLVLFKEIRKAHMKNELDGKFGQAEAQFVYMMNNIKLPQGCSVDALDTMIEQISTLMYLLPSIHDDPNPAYQNGALAHRQRRDQPFAEGEMTEMLFNSMPYALQKLWKLDNGNQLVPTDRQLLKQELKILMEKNKDKLEEERQDKSQGNGGGKDGKKRKTGDQKPGPAPSTPNASGGGGPGGRDCKFCKKNGERPEAYQRHTTAKCKKYLNIEGKINPNWKPSAQFRQNNAHQLDEGETPLSEKKKRKKSKKKRKKKSKSKRKKHKKARRASFSSSSSDSSTSSSSSSSSDGS